MRIAKSLNVSEDALAAGCAKFRVQALAVFGSAARGEFQPESDIDLLVLFSEGVPVTLFTLIELQAELADLFARHVDLVPKNGLKATLRREVLAEAQVPYAAVVHQLTVIGEGAAPLLEDVRSRASCGRDPRCRVPRLKRFRLTAKPRTT